MNKLYLILLCITLLIGCSEDKRSEIFNEPKSSKEYKIDESTIVKSYIIDSCEYVGYLAATMSKVNYLTHKGNCSFCAKRNQK